MEKTAKFYTFISILLTVIFLAFVTATLILYPQPEQPDLSQGLGKAFIIIFALIVDMGYGAVFLVVLLIALIDYAVQKYTRVGAYIAFSIVNYLGVIAGGFLVYAGLDSSNFSIPLVIVAAVIALVSVILSSVNIKKAIEE